MSKKRLFLIGYFLMLVGIGIPLYSFLNLTLNDIKKAKKLERYIETSNDKEKAEKNEINKEIDEYNKRIEGTPPGIVDPFSTEGYTANYGIKGEKEDPFCYIKIPKIDVVLPVYLGASYKHLSMGAAHVDGTNLPLGGDNTRSVIAGHRGFYKDIMFLNLHELEEGDDIYLYRFKDVYHYKVKDSEIITPYDWDKLEIKEGEDILTLLTCDPITPPSPMRLIVNAKRYIDKTPVALEKNKDTKIKDDSVKVSDDVKKVMNGTKIITCGLLILWFSVFIWGIYHFYKIRKKEIGENKRD